MGSKYGSYKFEPDKTREEKQMLHPVWRGIGFVLMILVPVMSYATTDVLLKQNDRYGWVVLTPDMMARPGQFLYSIIPDEMLYIKIGVFLLCLIIFFAVFSLISFFIYGMFGSREKNDPFYVPPVRRTTPRRRR